MRSTHRFSVLTTALAFSVSLAYGQEAPDPSVLVGKIANWSAPAYWSPPAPPVSEQDREGGLRRQAVEALPTSPVPFIGITPCRLVNTTNAAFPATYGPPALIADTPRSFALNSDPQCPGIPFNVQAYSLNITAAGTQGPGFIVIYPQGGAVPAVSTLNYVGGQTIANAAIVSAGTGGGVTVIAGTSGTHLIIDINGYYAGAAIGPQNTFLGLNAGNFTMTGNFNTGFGHNALFSNTTGQLNTAIGESALRFNTEGSLNTATGQNALANNTIGSSNTASGAEALGFNTTGSYNTAIGFGALEQNITGSQNTAIGLNALASNSTGSSNTASGFAALSNNAAGFSNTATGEFALSFGTTGSNNTASGVYALQNNTGNANIALGALAGMNLTTGSSNICIGNSGVAGESNTIRIGTVGTQTATFIAGISGATSSGGIGVFVNGVGQLGTMTSSRRIKEDIREIAGESDGLMRLRPVAFKYKHEIDPTGLGQYGLIAEEVADVYPDLVVYDRDGQPETVRYHLVNALLLNEVQKQHRTMEAQEKMLAQQKEAIDHEQAEIEVLKARLGRLEAWLLADSRP
jgi:hypothetical protein